MFLIMYVDDILIIGNDIPTLQTVKICLSNQFSLKERGEATYILGNRIYRGRSRGLLSLSQSTYIDKVLKWFSMELSKRGNIPMLLGFPRVHASHTWRNNSKKTCKIKIMP